MYDKNDKRRIYQLISMYIEKKIDEETFCNDFLSSYDLYLDYETLSEEEYEAFSELGKIASRFSEYEEDIIKYPGLYSTKESLNQKIVEIRNRLAKFFNEY